LICFSYIDIIEAFKSSLRKIKWMDKKSADAAATKARLLLTIS
jgi:hypothetical protein